MEGRPKPPAFQRNFLLELPELLEAIGLWGCARQRCVNCFSTSVPTCDNYTRQCHPYEFITDPETSGGRVAAGVHAFSLLLILASYTANLAAKLSEVPVQPIHGVTDFSTLLPACVRESTTLVTYLNNTYPAVLASKRPVNTQQKLNTTHMVCSHACASRASPCSRASDGSPASLYLRPAPWAALAPSQKRVQSPPQLRRASASRPASCTPPPWMARCAGCWWGATQGRTAAGRRSNVLHTHECLWVQHFPF